MKKKRTIIAIVLLTAVIAIGVGTLLNTLVRNRLADNLLDEYQEQQELIGRQVAQNLENNLAAIQEKLYLVAALPEVRSGDTAACNAKLNEAFEIFTAKVGNLGRVNADGRFHCSINKALIGIKAETLGSYIPQIFNDPAHKPVLSRMFIPPAGTNSYIAALHVPVYDLNRKFAGTLGGAIYFDELQEKYLKDVRFAENGFVSLLDDNGDILYHPFHNFIGKNVDDPEVKKIYGGSSSFREGIAAAQKGKSGKIRYYFNDEERILTYQPARVMPGHHWIVNVAVPTKDAAHELASVGVNAAFVAFTVVLSLAVILIAVMMLINLLKSYELQKTKDEFVNLASHQLRTPATAVMDYIDLVLDGIGGKVNNRQRELLQVARDSNQRQIRIIGDMLNVARLDAGRIKLKREPADIGKLVSEVIAEQRSTIAARKQTIDFTATKSPVSAPLDGTYGRMVFENLLSNASKYTPQGGKLSVSVGVHDTWAVIQVRDNGVGIAKKDMGKLFARLSRIPNQLSDEVGGTGLGLYLVKQIVELHKGSIEARSTDGKGSEFTVRLPLADQPPEQHS